MIYSILMVTEVLLSIGLITLILMQHGKGADAGAAFGSGASGTVFGSSGAGNFLSRTTAVLATLFFLNCLGLAYIVSHQSSAPSVIDTLPKTSVPAVSEEPPTTDIPGAGEPAAAGGAAGPEDIPE